ncbi:MAG: hypothetical protein LBP22_08775 [Deltaproteobacteria bacterium]|jgi:hypothetical protein|nr:hypothetical protein [Deltaproteobacteria bacterium]
MSLKTLQLSEALREAQKSILSKFQEFKRSVSLEYPEFSDFFRMYLIVHKAGVHRRDPEARKKARLLGLTYFAYCKLMKTQLGVRPGDAREVAKKTGTDTGLWLKNGGSIEERREAAAAWWEKVKGISGDAR